MATDGIIGSDSDEEDEDGVYVLGQRRWLRRRIKDRNEDTY